MVTLKELRARISPKTKNILTEIWNAFLRDKSWPLTRSVHSKFGKEDTVSSLREINGSIISESSDGGVFRYQLRILGVLITENGSAYEALLVRYLEYLRHLFQNCPEKQSVSSKEATAYMSLSVEDEAILGPLIIIGNLFSRGASQGDNRWEVGIFVESEDFPSGPLEKILERILIKTYVPNASVFYNDQIAALSHSTKDDVSVTMNTELISIKTRQVFREQMVGWVLREISDEFDAAKVDCNLSFQPSVSGQRRTLIEQYYHTVDWSNSADIKKILMVFENVLHRAENLMEDPLFSDDRQLELRKKEIEKLIHFLGKDGFQWVNGKIVAAVGLPMFDEIKKTAAIFDAQHMADQIRRMESGIDSDPSLAIGTAKELIETCCKTILAERGKPVTGTPDISTLTKDTLKELKLVPDGIPDSARGSDVIKRLLNNLGVIGNSLAELRGLYGTGHGKHGKATGLAPRHARLAVGAAATLVTFLFETHKDTKT